MQPAYVPQRLPETMSAKEIGAHMAQLRQQFNLTQQEVSERLHIRTRYVNAIEEGKFDLMPGKVYARGYIHTYAEFLGLDPDQVVALCFADNTAPAGVKPTAAPVKLVSSRSAQSNYNLAQRNWRGYGLIVVAVIAVLVVVSQFAGSGPDAAFEEATVAPVPEDILQSVRNLVMPTPNNNECLTKDTTLSCFYADNVTRDLMRIKNEELRFADDLDLSSVALPVAVEGEAEPETAHVNEEVPAETTADEEVAPSPAEISDE